MLHPDLDWGVTELGAHPECFSVLLFVFVWLFFGGGGCVLVFCCEMAAKFDLDQFAICACCSSSSNVIRTICCSLLIFMRSLLHEMLINMASKGCCTPSW